MPLFLPCRTVNSTVNPIEFLNNNMKTQRELAFFSGLAKPKFASKAVIDKFADYREAVIWCWDNRVNVGAGEKIDQAICANLMGLTTSQMSRCVKRDSHAPMNLNPDLLDSFEAFCGWSAASQFLIGRKQWNIFEQIMEERRPVAA